MEGLWRTQDMARSEPFQHVPGVLIVILSFPDIWAGKCCPMVLFTCVSSISSPPTLFSAHSNLVSSLPLYLWPQNATKSNGWLSVPILLGSPPQSSVHSLPWLLSLCIPPAYPAAPFWLLFDFLFFQCPLNDNQSLSLSLIYLEPQFFSLCTCPKLLYMHFQDFNYHLYTMNSQIFNSRLSFELQTHIVNQFCYMSFWLL